MKRTLLAAALCCALPVLATPGRSTQEIIDTAPADAWRTPDPANLLYMQLDKGTVVFELAPDFAPEHVAQIKLLAQQHFWDGLSVYRVQDNYVAQFGDPDAEDKAKAKPLPPESKALPAEFTRPLAGLAFTALPDKDGWAKQVGFAGNSDSVVARIGGVGRCTAAQVARPFDGGAVGVLFAHGVSWWLGGFAALGLRFAGSLHGLYQTGGAVEYPDLP